MGLHPYLLTIAGNLHGVARSLGFSARVTSGYRSPAKQAQLYQRYLQGLMPYPVAPPGHSDHEKGLAIDVVSTDIPKLVSLLTEVGLSWYGPDDPVHFSLKGRKSQAMPKSAGKAYAQGPGSSIPSWLSNVPMVGDIFGMLRSPSAVVQEKGRLLLSAITRGWL